MGQGYGSLTRTKLHNRANPKTLKNTSTKREKKGSRNGRQTEYNCRFRAKAREEKRLRAIRREIVDPLYQKKEEAKLAAKEAAMPLSNFPAQEAALNAPKLPVRSQNTGVSSMDVTSTTSNTNNNDMEDPEVEVTASESEEGDEDVKLAQPSKNAIYNRDGLLDKLADISWPDNVEWIHKLSVDIDREQVVDVNDDLTRELDFYSQALKGTRQAFLKLQSAGLPFLRPSDYYAEMVKSDAHMERVKGRLLAEKRKIEESEDRRKARENKKLAKEIQAQTLKERAKQKKEEIESVKKWRKQRQRSGFAGDDKDGELDFAFDDGKTFERSKKTQPGVAPGDRSGGKAGKGAGRWKKGSDKSKKSRDFKNSKFGHGGRKGLKKQNTSETTSDLRGFNSNFSSKKRKR